MTPSLDPQKLEEFNAYIVERGAVRLRKEAGLPRPWSSDPMFQKFKFTCVHREDDRTTRWIAANWRDPNMGDPDLWFSMVIARRALNWPDCMEALGYPVPWNPDHFIYTLNYREEKKLKCYDTAYQLLVQGQKGNKAEMMVKHILNPLWEARKYIRPHSGDLLKDFADRLSSFKYMGLFYTGQVVADLKYAQLQTAPDWDTFVLPGPGSERGLNRVCGRAKNTPWKTGEWEEAFRVLHDQITTVMHAQDLQNCLCEADKYWRALGGEGRVRPYHPHADL